MRSENTIEIIFKLVDDKKEYSQFELNSFIELSYKIALYHICKKQTKLYSIIKRESIAFEDIAIDSISLLFSREEEGFPLLRNAYNKWLPKIETNEDACFFLNQILAKLANQQINTILKESNPFFTKVLTRINYLARISGYSKKYFMGICYLVEKETDFVPPFVPTDQFEQLSMQYPLNEKKILQNIFDILRQDECYTPAIPLNALVYKMINIHAVGIKDNIILPSSIDRLAANEFIESELRFVKKKIKHTYLKTGKLTEDEAVIVYKTVESIAQDMKQGGTQSPVFSYFSEHATDVSLDVYQDNYHNILEYLLKIFKGRILKGITA